MVLYRLGVAVILGTAGIRSQPVGVALWPAVVLHAAMTVWCIRNFLGGNAAHATDMKPKTTERQWRRTP
jgi:hypothetical protein